MQILSLFNLLQYLYLSNCLFLSNLNKGFNDKLYLLSNYSDSEEILKPDLNKPLPSLPGEDSDSDWVPPVYEDDSDFEKDLILDESSFDFDEFDDELKQLDEESLKSRENLCKKIIDDLEMFVNLLEKEDENEKLFKIIE